MQKHKKLPLMNVKTSNDMIQKKCKCRRRYKFNILFFLVLFWKQ